MKIELPLETWTELFGFIPRSQLIQLVPHFGETLDDYTQACKCHQTIEDRQFVSFVQFFLHKCGKITLGDLYIFPSENGNEPTANVSDEYRRTPLPMADVPIPENVKNFESILILSSYGESVIAFLQKFQQNSLLTNVKVSFHRDMDVLDRLQSEYSEVPVVISMFTFAQVLTVLNFGYNSRDYWFSDWLHISREDGKARVLFLHGCCNYGYGYEFGYGRRDRTFSHVPFINHIKKHFLEANQAVSFFIELERFHDQASIQSLTLENGQTREKLVIRANGNYHPATISRCPMGTNEQNWMEEMSEDPYYYNKTIKFDGN